MLLFEDLVGVLYVVANCLARFLRQRTSGGGRRICPGHGLLPCPFARILRPAKFIDGSRKEDPALGIAGPPAVCLNPPQILSHLAPSARRSVKRSARQPGTKSPRFR